MVRAGLSVVVVRGGHCVAGPGAAGLAMVDNGEGRTVLEGLDKVLVTDGLLVVVLPLLGLVGHAEIDGVYVCQGRSVV